VKAWIVMYNPGYEEGTFLGVYATEEVANEAKAREVAKPDYPPAEADVYVWEEDVLAELPPAPARYPFPVLP
jgi:hypothetical protein